MSKKFSVLICTLEDRKHLLDRLMKVLQPQLTDDVEILVKSDNAEMPIGRKRNMLLDEANGQYVAFVDDDDLVSTDYIRKVLAGIVGAPDCCGLQGIITFQGKSPRTFIHSLKYKEWFEKNHVYYRCPNHLNPVKKELAMQVKFPESNFGEDKDYSTRLFPLLKNEYYIPGVIYHYLYEKGPAPSDSNRIRTQSNLHPRITKKHI